MNVTLRQISYFIAVAEAGSVSGGAAAVGISQSAITEALKALEQQTGTQLFERTPRGVLLTHPGHQFLRHARAIVAAVADAQNALNALPEAVHGTLELGVTPIVAGYFLADLLARFRRVFPRVAVNVHEEDRSYLEHLMVNGEITVALILTSNIENRDAVEHEALVSSPFRLWLPPDHALMGQEAITLAQIAELPLIALDVDELTERTESHWRYAGLVPNRVLRTTSVEAVRSLVATGAGVAILPDMAYRPWSLEGDRIEARPIVDAPRPLEVGVAWRRGSALPATAETFIRLAREHHPTRRR